MFCIAVVGQIECETHVQSVVVALKSCPTSILGDNTLLFTLLIQINIDVVSKNITGRPFLCITFSKKVVQNETGSSSSSPSISEATYAKIPPEKISGHAILCHLW